MKWLHSGSTMRLGKGIVPMVLWMVTGCSPEENGPAASDSNELPVLHQVIDRSRLLTLDAQWRVGDAADPNQLEFFRVWAAARSDDGRTFILEPGNHRINVLDEDGGLIRQFGSEGDGPGEFRGAYDFAVARDTVIVMDRRNRVHFFGTDGTALVTHLVEFPDEEVNSLGAVASTSKGWVVGATGYFRGGGSGLSPILRTYSFSLDPVGGDVTPLGLRWEVESVGQFDGVFWVQPILEHRPAGDMDGVGRFLTAETAAYQINVHGLDGAALLRVDNQAAPAPLDDEVIELWKASRDCPPGSDVARECSQQRDQLALSMPRSTNRPFVGGLRVYPSGHFSVLRADLDPNPFDQDTPSEYDHFAPDGTFLGATSGIIPLWFDGDKMVSLERDLLGVETVVLYNVTAG